MTPAPKWDEMVFITVKNPTGQFVAAKLRSGLMAAPYHEVLIEPGKSVSVNMQYAATLEIAGLVIGPITEEGPRK